MLVALLLLAHLGTHVPYEAGTLPPQVSAAAYSSHLAHERHLAHLHRLHMRHMQHLGAVPPDRSYGVTVATRAGGRVPSGRLGCIGLESLWEAAGGAYPAAFVAAEIAMAESGGDQYATGPAGERGYWQINPDHGALSTYAAYGNARAAIIISDDGRSWSAWTTYVTGAYRGKCLLAVTAFAGLVRTG